MGNLIIWMLYGVLVGFDCIGVDLPSFLSLDTLYLLSRKLLGVEDTSISGGNYRVVVMDSP